MADQTMYAPLAVAATLGTVAIAYVIRKISSAPLDINKETETKSKSAAKRHKKMASKKENMSELDRLSAEIGSLSVKPKTSSKKKPKKKAKKISKQVEDTRKPKDEVVEEVEADDEISMEGFAGVKSNKDTVEDEPIERRRKSSTSEQAKEVFTRAKGGLAVSHTEYITEFNDDEWTEVASNYKKKQTEVLRFKDFSYGEILKMAKQAELLTQSAPRVDIDKHLHTITITGEPEEVLNTKKAFEEILDTLQAQADAKRDEMVELGNKWHIVAGTKFENMKRIQNETGAKLNLEKETNVLTISGLHAQVDAALAQVDLALNPPEPEHRSSLPLSRFQAMIILGPSGSRIREIQKQSGAKLDLEGDRNSDSRVLVISGHDQKQVMHANSSVLNILHQYSHEATIPLTRDGISLLLYNDGAELKELRKLHGDVSINLDREAEKIDLKGEQAALESVKAKIYQIITTPPQPPKMKSGQKFEAIELGDATAAVIGKGYSNIKNIKLSCSVEMDIPPTTQQAWIWGKSENVQKAKGEVFDLIKKYNDKMNAEKNAQDSRNQFIAYQENAVDFIQKEKGLPWGGSVPIGW